MYNLCYAHDIESLLAKIDCEIERLGCFPDDEILSIRRARLGFVKELLEGKISVGVFSSMMS